MGVWLVKRTAQCLTTLTVHCVPDRHVMRLSRFLCFSGKRRWICPLAFLLLFIIILFLSGYQSRFMTLIIARIVSPRYTSKELEAMIPVQKEILLQSRKLSLQQSEEVTKPRSPSNINRHLDDIVSNDPLFPTAVTCQPIDPKVLFFVRIPKCASTSFVEQLRGWSKKGSQFELFFHPSGAFDWDIRTIKKVANQVNARRSNRFVYARHFYYTDFRMYGVEDYSYLTIIRDPVSRFISSFLYYHYSSKAHIQAILNPEHKNETLLECVEHQHEGCAHNWLTKYFCGHDKFCKLGNEQALKIAKENLLRDFTAVGILEELELSMTLFETLLPGYFKAVGGEKLAQTNKNEHSIQLSSREEEAVLLANKADIELYNFARSLFHRTTKACKLR